MMLPLSRMRSSALGLVVLALVLVTMSMSARLSAVLVEPMSIAELTKQADIILRGKVLSRTCEPSPGTQILTRVEIEVHEVWKGANPGARFQVVLAGGTLGNRRVVVPGQATYTPGEEIVAFLRKNDRGEGVTLSLCQGKFEIFTDATGKSFARNMFHGNGPAEVQTSVRGAGGLASQAAPNSTAAVVTTAAATTTEGRIPVENLKRLVAGGGDQ